MKENDDLEESGLDETTNGIIDPLEVVMIINY